PFSISQIPPALLLLRLLIQPEHVASRIGKARGQLRRVDADGLHDLAAGGFDRRDRRLEVVDHDVHEQARLARPRLAPLDPRARDLDAVVEGEGAVAAHARLPAEQRLVERRRAIDVGRGQLEVADLAVRRDHVRLLGWCADYRSAGRQASDIPWRNPSSCVKSPSPLGGMNVCAASSASTAIPRPRTSPTSGCTRSSIAGRKRPASSPPTVTVSTSGRISASSPTSSRAASSSSCRGTWPSVTSATRPPAAPACATPSRSPSSTPMAPSASSTTAIS